MHAAPKSRKALKTGPVRRDATSPRNSMCGSAQLADLDWSHWWTDGSNGELYLHVRRLHPDIDGTDEADATWHRVFCRQTDKPRLTVISGKIFWLIDRPNGRGEPSQPLAPMKKQTDKQRLDWLENNNARLQNEAEDEGSLPHAVVYLPTLENGVSKWRLAARGISFRVAIDAAMRG